MFGYLQVDKAELKVREWEAYKSVYCGLCRQMGRDYSFLSRLALSYDCTYYAMLLMSVRRRITGRHPRQRLFQTTGNTLSEALFRALAQEGGAKIPENRHRRFGHASNAV